MIQPHTLVDVDEEIYDEIGFEIDLCPRDALEFHVRRTFVDFCERTHFWQHPVTIVTVPGTTSYEVSMPDGHGLIEVISVTDTVNEIDLTKSQDSAVAYRYWNPTPGYVEIFSDDFTAVFDLDVVVAARPLMVASVFQISKQLQDEYRTAIIAGAKSALYKIPNKSWTNLQQAQIDGATYQAIVNDARLHVANGYSRMPLASIRKTRPFY